MSTRRTLRTRRTRTRGAAIATGIATLALLTGACSSGGDSGSGSQDKADGGKGKQADAAFKERECLRKHGLKVSEPKSGEDTRGITIGGDMSKEKMEAAMKACNTGKGGGMSGSGPTQADKDKMLKYAQCMRKNGFNMPDPKFEGGAMEAQKIPKGAEAKKMEKAAKACKDIVA
ncbi:hypothetical protein [Streptomyces sp. NPDC051214]|uniref:hypothetical protein n=1 Tax=Streptomyces sp. NPDC051214 TaxID=3155282 RepID=UPI00341D941C